MYLNKLKIIHTVASLYFPFKQFSLLMGAALVMHGVKEFASDIDLGCTTELFEKLRADGFSVTVSRSGYEKIIVNSNVSVYKGWMPSQIVVIEGMPIADLGSIINDKKNFNRPKDIADIALIQKFILDESGEL